MFAECERYLFFLARIKFSGDFGPVIQTNGEISLVKVCGSDFPAQLNHVFVLTV